MAAFSAKFIVTAKIMGSHLPILEVSAKPNELPTGLLTFSEPFYVAKDIPTIQEYLGVLHEICQELTAHWLEY